MVLQYLKPSEIRFTQDSIAGRFQNGGLLNNAILEIQNGLLDPTDFPTISVVHKNGKLYSFDNRRLYVFRVAEYRGIISQIPVSIVEPWRLREDRFTTENDGVTIYVRQGGTKEHYRKPWLQQLDDHGNRNLSPNIATSVVKHENLPPAISEYSQSQGTGQVNQSFSLFPEISTANPYAIPASSSDATSGLNMNQHENVPAKIGVIGDFRELSESSESSYSSSTSSRSSSLRPGSHVEVVVEPETVKKHQPEIRVVQPTVPVINQERPVAQTHQKKKSRFRRFLECFCCCCFQ